MANNTPGVYIEEISTLPASVAGVETAIPAFIGYTEKAEEDGDETALFRKPTKIKSLLEFKNIFGGPENETITVSVDNTVDTLTSEILERKITTAIASPSNFKLFYSIQLFFQNGGGDCYIVSVGDYDATIEAGDGTTVLVASVYNGGITGGINLLEKVDEPTLLVFPDATSVADLDAYGQIVGVALTHCNKLQDRFTIADVYGSDFTLYRGKIGNSYLKYGAAYYPDLETTFNYGYDESEINVSFKNNGVVDTDAYTLAGLADTLPSVYRAIVSDIKDKHFVTLPPSGAMAGIYARVDSERGVWKAPANVGVRAVNGPSVKITNDDQESLNVDPTTGKSINAIRTFAGKGTLVWGARTFAGNDNEWRYVPVRRLYIFVEESVKKATEFVVFEPNDANTWLRVKTMIENFLTTLWRNGALQGAKAEDSYFVKVGLGLTMTADDILNGIMNVEIGMAAVRPAEFIILKFSHKLQES
ncbi:MAG: phage tail sheath family protein [Bacteroidales bacterium]|nr:phage tail sheath family protein [Bacteroidales bacterium]